MSFHFILKAFKQELLGDSSLFSRESHQRVWEEDNVRIMIVSPIRNTDMKSHQKIHFFKLKVNFCPQVWLPLGAQHPLAALRGCIAKGKKIHTVFVFYMDLCFYLYLLDSLSFLRLRSFCTSKLDIVQFWLDIPVLNRPNMFFVVVFLAFLLILFVF